MWLTLIGIVSLGLFLFARSAKPANSQAGEALTELGESSNSKETLTVSSYNVQTGKSLEGKRNILRSAEVIKNADIVGIQEVYAATWLNKIGFGRSQTQALANHSGFNYLFAATRLRWFREHRGNALLSRIAVKRWYVAMLPDFSNKSYRNMVVAEFVFKGQTCHIINTHLHTRKGRSEQLQVVLDEFKKYPRAILMGDFNTTFDDPILTKYIKNSPTSSELIDADEIVDAISLAEIEPDTGNRIDWVLTKGFKVIHGEVKPKGISDHPYYQLTLALI